MALHPRLARPSLELPPRRTSHGLLAGLVLAVMGTGFALAMPVAMKTWSEAARKTETVARVNAAQPPTERFADPLRVIAPVVEEAFGPHRREPQRLAEPSTVAHPSTGGRQVFAPDPRDEPAPPSSDPRDDDGEGDDEPTPQPSPPDGKRDEDDEPEEAPDTDDEDPDDPSQPSDRATGRDEGEPEDEPGPNPDPKDESDAEDEASRSGSVQSGGGSQGHTKGNGR